MATTQREDVRTAQFGVYPDLEAPFAVLRTEDEDPEMPLGILQTIQSHIDTCDGQERSHIEPLTEPTDPAGEVRYTPGRTEGEVLGVTLYSPENRPEQDTGE